MDVWVVWAKSDEAEEEVFVRLKFMFLLQRPPMFGGIHRCLRLNKERMATVEEIHGNISLACASGGCRSLDRTRCSPAAPMSGLSLSLAMR